MVLSPTADQQAAVDQDNQIFVYAVELTFFGVVVYRYCQGDDPQVIDGDTYLPVGVRVDGIKISDLGSQSATMVQLNDGDLVLSKLWQAYGAGLSGGAATIYQAIIYEGAWQIVQTAVGKIGDMSGPRGYITFEIDLAGGLTPQRAFTVAGRDTDPDAPEHGEHIAFGGGVAQVG